MAEAGPVPHDPKTGRVVTFNQPSSAVTEVFAGAPLLVDVELGRGSSLYALSQGDWSLPNLPENAGAPADPGTGTLIRIDRDGTMTTIAGDLDRPTSFEIVGRTAYVVTLSGTVVKITNI